jgi:hypothetical protein
VEARVVVGAVEAAGRRVGRLEHVDAPDRSVDADGDGGVHRSLELVPLEHPQLEAHAALGAESPWSRFGSTK